MMVRVGGENDDFDCFEDKGYVHHMLEGGKM